MSTTHPAPTYPSLDELLERAAQEAGADDPGDPDFREGFERFLSSLDDDAELSPAGAEAVVTTLLQRLRNRFEVEAWHREHPEAGIQPVTGPLVITGLPRTGTTALANMLSLDGRFRSLRMWEQRQPLPPPDASTEQDDPRRRGAQRSVDDLLTAQPELGAMHLWDVDATMEDTEVLGMAGRPQNAPVPVYGYHRWWRTCDMRGAYRFHRRVASLLQYHRPPNRWLFKSPHLSCHLEDFLVAYPDARFVMTHRDPIAAVPSWISFVSSLTPPGTDETLDPVRFGRHLAEHLATNARRIVEARERLDPERFLDLHHRELREDPLDVIARVERFAGLELTDEVRASITAWSVANGSGSHGTHRYTLEQFGLDADRIAEEFAPYLDRFEISAGG